MLSFPEFLGLAWVLTILPNLLILIAIAKSEMIADGMICREKKAYATYIMFACVPFLSLALPVIFVMFCLPHIIVTKVKLPSHLE